MTIPEEYKFLPNIPLDSQEKAEDLLRKDLLKLSFQDRNSIVEEIHGVRSVYPNETTELLHSSLKKLSTELAKIPDKPAFEKSQRLFPNDTYVNTMDFRLRFLRCECLDAKKAAIRMVNFLDLIDELFEGNEVLRRPIKLSDLSKAEMKILRSGIFQLLPYRDRSGRPIFVEAGNMGFHYCLKMRTKIRLYFFFIACNDEESQIKGLICIAWPEGDFTNSPMPLHQESRRLIRRAMAGFPIRITAIHFCMPDTIYFRLLGSFVITFFPKRTRVKVHVATGIERRYRLKGFGIPVEMIPITDTGNVKRTYLYQWIKVRKSIESNENAGATKSQTMILLPRSNDVLIRTGTTTLSHPGNVFFRGLIEMKHEEFRSGSEFTQSFLAEDIVEEIERLKGHFLTWDSRGFWTDLRDRNQIIFKVEVSIRDFKVKLKARKNVQIAHSSTNRFQLQHESRTKRTKLLNDINDSSNSNEDSGLCSYSCQRNFLCRS